MRPLVMVLLALVFTPALTAFASAASAQDLVPVPTPSPLSDRLVDRVVAVVGDSAIFYSHVFEDRLRHEASGVPIPDDPEALQAFDRELLGDIIARTLILQAAERDTLITVSEERVEATFQEAWADEIERFGSEAEMRRILEAAGMNIAQRRANLRAEIRNGLLLQSYVQVQRRLGRVPPVDEAEARAFFEQERPNFGARPATISFRQVVLLPVPSDSAKAAAREEAERILGLLRSGEDFADLARRFSDDPGSGQRGGELGWIRQGETVQEFEDAAFRLGRGQVSEVVESIFGAHIIRVDRIRGPERMIHHILVAATPVPGDVERARTRAREIRNAVAAGTPLSEFSDEGQQVEIPNELEMPLDQLGQLPGDYPFALREAQEGDVLGPVEFTSFQGQPAFAVVVVDELREAGELRYEDYRDQIREFLEGQRFEQRLIERLMAETHVDVRW